MVVRPFSSDVSSFRLSYSIENIESCSDVFVVDTSSTDHDDYATPCC
jgi:hypothetical protein